MINKTAIFSTAYFPSVQYFTEIVKGKNIVIEKHENYVKQSYRNRCKILSTNGIQTLSIPVKKISGQKIPIADTQIDYTESWQQVHFKSIATAYQKSPFYEFYIDAFEKFFTKKYKFLFDFNTEILETLLSELEIEKKISFTEKYEVEIPNYNDFRNSINPKNKFDKDFLGKKYIQVFSNKFNFAENLSILDLLFNEGTNVYKFL